MLPPFTLLEGEDVWKWRDSAEGRWSIPLLKAALATTPKTKPGNPEQNATKPVLFLLEYRDGLHAAAYLLNGHTSGFLFAGKLKGKAEPVATHCGFLDGGRPLAHFDGLVHCIEEMFITGQPLYPIERTLLTSGAALIPLRIPLPEEADSDTRAEDRLSSAAGHLFSEIVAAGRDQ